MRWTRMWCAVAVAAATLIVATPNQQHQQQQSLGGPSESAVKSIAQLSPAAQSELVKNVKSATDGLQIALQGISANDVAKVLKGIGDVLVELPKGFGAAGVAFSLAASVFTLASGSSGKKADPVLAALNKLSKGLGAEMTQLQHQLDDVNAKLSGIIASVDHVLNGISDIPSKVVAEMQMTAISVMKDKFANVLSHAALYARGDLTRLQMISKCEDFAVPSLLSELETILKDDNGLFGAKFGHLDRANGEVQAQLLGFYVAVVPLVTNCNALEYSIESLQEDWMRIHELTRAVHQRVSWLLSPADRVVHVKERFAPFGTLFDVNGYQQVAEYQLALSLQAYSASPPHGACFQVSSDSKQLVSFKLEPRQPAPSASVFCVKAVQTDDATHRVVYAERDAPDAGLFSIAQPEAFGEFDPLGERGWTKNAVAFYVPKVAHWKRFSALTLVADFVILQAASPKISLDDLTHSCKALGDGYDRDGDGHSKDYKGAPWTIFCVRYVRRTIREIDSATGPVLTDVQFNEMEPAKAWSAPCSPGYVRDRNMVPIPSKTSKGWLTGTSTAKAYAVCLKWEQIATGSAPNRFVRRVWLDDAADMPHKPKVERNQGDGILALPEVSGVGDLANV